MRESSSRYESRDRWLEKTVVGRGCSIGANATILPGIRIGADAVVGAGAVVTRDVKPGTVVAGNPAVEINRTENLPYGVADS